VLYVGDIEYCVVQGFLWDWRWFMDWCVNSIKKRQCLRSVVLMCKLIKSDRRMLIRDLFLNVNFCGCSCRTVGIKYRCKVSRNIPTEWEWTVSSSKSFISEGRKWFVNDTAKYHILLVYHLNPGNIVSLRGIGMWVFINTNLQGCSDSRQCYWVSVGEVYDWSL